MNSKTQHRHTRSVEESRELRSYIWGLVFALILTLIPFALVYFSVLSRPAVLMSIAVLAIVQIVVHFRFFLHIDLSKQKRDDLQLILFTTLVLFLMAGGTIWVMGNLVMRMMP